MTKTYEIKLVVEVVAGSFKPEKNVHLLQGSNILSQLGTCDSPEEVQVTSLKSRLCYFDEVTPEGIIKDCIKKFPGLVDGETEVSGADLVEHLTYLIDHMKNHRKTKPLK